MLTLRRSTAAPRLTVRDESRISRVYRRTANERKDARLLTPVNLLQPTMLAGMVASRISSSSSCPSASKAASLAACSSQLSSSAFALPFESVPESACEVEGQLSSRMRALVRAAAHHRRRTSVSRLALGLDVFIRRWQLRSGSSGPSCRFWLDVVALCKGRASSLGGGHRAWRRGRGRNARANTRSRREVLQANRDLFQSPTISQYHSVVHRQA